MHKSLILFGVIVLSFVNNNNAQRGKAKGKCKAWFRNGCEDDDGSFGGRQVEPAPVGGGPQPVSPNYRAGGIQLSQEDIAAIKETCRKRNCRVQSEEAKKRKERVKGLKLKESVASAEVEQTFTDILEAKRALLALNDLDTEIEPEDDGLWNGDLALNARQANDLKKSFQAIRRRKRASAMYFDAFAYNYKFKKNPIPYIIDNSLYSSEQQTIKSALSEIEQKSCLHFRQEYSTPFGEHLHFYKFSGSNEFECGQSPLGNQESVNYIYLDFANCRQNMKGVVLHQVLHSLGMHHTQTRIGRDNFVQIWWNNVDPQKYDSFYQADYSYFTTYGVPYDYFSVLHGSKTEKSVAPSLQTLKALKSPVDFFDAAMGQRDYLSSRDAEMIRKMYCQNDCSDTTVNCGYYHGLNYCDSNSGYADWMRYYCRKSCEWC